MEDTIHHSELTQLTGYDEKRFRQLAEAGWFPAPDRGQYKTLATLAGLIKYLKGLSSKKDPGLEEKRATGVEYDNRKKARDEQLALGQLLTLDEWKALTSETIPPLTQLITTILETELPSQCTGKSESELRVWGKRANVKFRARMKVADKKYDPDKVVAARKTKTEVD